MADVFYTLKGFRREEQLNNYMIGIGTDAHDNKINVALQQETNMIVIGYIADKNELLEVRYSPSLETNYSGMSLGEMQDVAERNAYWIMKEINTLQLSTFQYSERQLDDALVDAVPLQPKDAERIVPKVPTKAQVTLNAENYKYLYDLALNKDAETISAIKKLCKALLQADVSVVSIYNQQIFYNKAKNLTAADFLHIMQRIKKISKNLTIFLNKDFKSAEEVIQYVNNNYVDKSATGEATKFVINYPFDKLSYQQRKKILLLFLDSKTTLSFSGFWKHTLSDNYVSAGDIVFNLISTGNEADRAKLLQELEKEQKIFDLINADDEDYQFTIVSIITSAVMQTINGNEEKQIETFINTIEQQDFYFFDDALNKKQDAELDTKNKQILLLNKGHEKIPNIPGRAQLIAKSLQGKDIFEHDSTASEKEEAKYLLEKVSTKTLFNPLDIIAFTAESKISSELLTLEKDDTVLLPACMVYLLIKKAEEAKKWKAIGIAAAFIALPLSVVGLAAAIEAAAVWGVIVSATDVTVDAAFIAANAQGMDKEHPDFVKTVNNLAFFYGVARLGVGIAKGLPAALNKNWLEALKLVAKNTKDLIQSLRSSTKTDELFRDVFKFIDKGELSAYTVQKLSRLIERLTQAEINIAVKVHYVDEGSKEFKALYQAWAKSRRKPQAFFKPKTGYSGKYEMFVDGPALYMFKGGSIKPTSYTMQHELFHLKLWFTFIKLGKQGKALYARIPEWLHEADVIGEMLKANKRKPGKWNVDEISRDLDKLNFNIKNDPQIFGKDIEKIMGKRNIELRDLENWELTNYLEKF
jgi:hypothetical protein